MVSYMFLFIHIREMLINFIFKSVEVLFLMNFKTVVWKTLKNVEPEALVKFYIKSL